MAIFPAFPPMVASSLPLILDGISFLITYNFALYVQKPYLSIKVHTIRIVVDLCHIRRILAPLLNFGTTASLREHAIEVKILLKNKSKKI